MTAARVEKRLERVPGYGRLQSAGGMGELLVTVTKHAVKPPFPWWRDCVEECSLAIRRCLAPLLISIIFWTMGFAMLAVSGIVSTIGTPDRTGGGLAIGQVRESAYWITSMVFAGVVGSAMTADLGARKIREELEAMRVLGLDPIVVLAVPRILALVIVAPLLIVIGLMTGLAIVYILGPILLPVIQRSDYYATATEFMVAADMLSAIGKAAFTGLFVGVVCCYKGLATQGGAEGVGKAVNQAVLITFIALWAFGALWNQTFFALFPDVLTLRG